VFHVLLHVALVLDVEQQNSQRDDDGATMTERGARDEAKWTNKEEKAPNSGSLLPYRPLPPRSTRLGHHWLRALCTINSYAEQPFISKQQQQQE
jgi:hypothetical protein